MRREISPVPDLVALLRWLRLLVRLRPDVVNVGTPKAGLVGSIAAWLTRVPVRVYVMRGLRLEGARTSRERGVLWMAERLSVRLATDVICVSESLRDEASALKLFGRGDKPLVLGKGSSNGVNAERWDEGFAAVDRDVVRSEWQVDPRDLVVGFVGRIAYDKGVGDLLEAYEAVDDPRIRLLLVGPVEDEGLRSGIERLGDRVIHIDWTLDLYSVYVGMDVLCLPTRREGFPNVVLEAALAEVPCITTTATGSRDSVVPGLTGWLVAPESAPQLANAMRACAARPDEVREAGRAARERAISDFRPQAIWSALERVYLAGGSGAG
jgi:glycosyltransferase involved in cell wall biosynthesis